MLALLQRVNQASVSAEGCAVNAIKGGLLVFVAIQADDDERVCARLIERIFHYRVFADDNGKMNRSVTDVGGEVLLVPQFTLTADTRKGMRPSFSGGAPPQRAKQLFEWSVTHAAANYARVKAGYFGAEMKVALVNDGPATFLLSSGG